VPDARSRCESAPADARRGGRGRETSAASARRPCYFPVVAASGTEQLRRFSDAIIAAQRPIRILRAINWDRSVHERFFRHGARSLPRPEYPPLGFDPAEKVKELRDIRKGIRGRNRVEELLREKCDELSLLARMLAARGTRRFYELSRRVYGDPRDRFPDHPADNLAIARLWAARPRARDEEATLTAEEAAEQVRDLCAPYLGGKLQVLVRQRLTASAAAGSTRITLKKGAMFSARQVRALVHHEGLWHVLTSMNGSSQPVLRVLGVGFPRHTESQEGGGVVAEFLTDSITDERYIELGERTIAVDMAARGADYIEVYSYLLARFPPHKAAQMSERVFRGGVLEGGAPFTKDVAYQRGYCRTFNFLRAALESRDLDIVRAFVAGKMSVDEAELVRDLIEEGVCAGPVHLPAWFDDVDRLNAMVTHSLTMNRFSVPLISRYYARRRAQNRTVGAPEDADEVACGARLAEAGGELEDG
jgi:uncharacterized protein (TIGR02421 family)